MTYLMPSKEDMAIAQAIEDAVTPEQMELYLNCMDGFMLKDRTTARDIRDGCILIHNVFKVIVDNDD